MAKVKLNKHDEFRLVLNFEEAAVVGAVFQHVRLSTKGYGRIAADVCIALEPYFNNTPVVDFSYEDEVTSEPVEVHGICPTIEFIEEFDECNGCYNCKGECK